MAPQMKQTEHQSIHRRSLNSAGLKNVNLKVYKSVRVIDTKTDISGKILIKKTLCCPDLNFAGIHLSYLKINLKYLRVTIFNLNAFVLGICFPDDTISRAAS